tara:strand:+ start:236 stop:355 length:120 start_codon:yes stop_codon:yes gene_type:complete
MVCDGVGDVPGSPESEGERTDYESGESVEDLADGGDHSE